MRVPDVFDGIRNGNQSVADMLYHTLRRSIVSGRFAPGQRLVERDISQMAGVSRTPVREALRRLQAEGLVRDDRRGVEVLGLVPQRLEDVFAVRRLLRGLIAERATINADQSELDLLARLTEEAEALVNHQSSFLMSQDGFNVALTKAARIPIAEGFLQQLGDYLEEFRERSLSTRELRMQAAAEHRAIYEGVARRDPDAARCAADDHSKKSDARYMRVLNQAEADVVY
ncbi:MAG: GntR family transcriptional regulator [Bacillota bacterium]|nr:GntR family transcriptional regulator [Bacillota bacterium]